MNYKKNQNKNKIGKEIINKTKTNKEDDASHSIIENCHIFEYSSLSFKSEEEPNDIQDRRNKRNNIIDNSLNSNIKINHKKKNIYDNNYFKDFTDKLYNSDEHLNKKKKIQRKNISLHNVINLHGLIISNNNLNQKTSISKKERLKKKKKKSLFHDKSNKREEENDINKFRESLHLKSHRGENKNKESNNFGSFLKLKPKNKYPVKESYIDSIFKNSVNSKIYSIIRNNNENKDQSIKSIKTGKKNILNSEKNETKVEEEKEIPILDKSNITQNKIKIHTEKDTNFEQKKLSKKRNKWNPIKFCCCLSSGCIC